MRRYLGIKSHLLVRDVGIGLAVDVVAKSFDKQESFRTSRQGVTDNELCDNVQSLSGTGD